MYEALKALTEDLTAQEVAEVREIFRQEALHEAVAADRRIEALGRLNREGHRTLDGMGQLKSRFEITHLFAAATKQGADLRDPEFRDWLLKRDESDYARVTHAKPAIIVAPGSFTDGCRKRFSKTWS